MFCGKCGQQLSDDAKFCPKCGAPTKAAAPAETVEETVAPVVETVEEKVEEVAAPVEQTYEPTYAYSAADIPEPKKGGHAGLIIGIIVGVLVVAAGVVAALFFMGILMPAKFMLAKAVNNGKDDFIKEYAAGYESIETAYQDVDTSDMTVGTKVTLGDEAKDLLETYGGAAGYDLSWIDSAAFDMDMDIQDEQIGMKVKGSINDTEITSADIILDANTEMAYISLPDIVKGQAFEVDPQMESDEIAELIAQSTRNLQVSTDNYPTPEEMDKVLSNYTEILINDCKDADIKKAKKEIKAGDVTAKYTEISVELDTKLVAQLEVDMAEKMKDDDDLKEAFRTLSAPQFESGQYDDVFADFDEFWDYCMEDLDDATEEAQDKLDEVKKDKDANEHMGTLYVYVDNTCHIKGICLDFTEDDFKFEFYMPEDGDQTGLLVRAEDIDSEEFAFEGQGETKKDLFNGTYKLVIEDEDICSIEIKDFDVKEYEKRNCKGEIVFTPESGLGDMINEPSLKTFVLADYAIKFDTEGLTGTITFDVRTGKKSLVTIDMTYAMEDVEDMSIPSNTVDIEKISDEEVYNLIKSLELSTVVNNLEKAGVPADYYQKLKDLNDAIASGNDVNIAYALAALSGEDMDDFEAALDPAQYGLTQEDIDELAALSYEDFSEIMKLVLGDDATDTNIKMIYDYVQSQASDTTE